MIEFLKGLVKSTKEIIQKGAGNIKEKGYADYVTDADIAIQDYITNKLKKQYPDCGILAEEGIVNELDNKPTFILDPIDGTTNYKYGLGFFGVCLGFAVNKKIQCGVVYDPLKDELFYAQSGKGAYLNGKKIEVNSKCDLKDCLISIGTSPYDRIDVHKRFLLFEKIFSKCNDLRRLGSASLDMCYTACGRVDGFLEYGLHIWDYAAAMIILKEAGGVVTDTTGNPIDLAAIQSNIVAGNFEINRQLVNVIGGLKCL